MKVITLWQPWASFIEFGWKTIETRTHDRFKNLVGETIAIHAGQKWDDEAYELAKPYLFQDQYRDIDVIKERFLNDNPIIPWYKGSIIATAKIEKAHWLLSGYWVIDAQALCKCDNDLFGLFLTDIKPIKPIPAKGKQGIWNYEGELIYLSDTCQ